MILIFAKPEQNEKNKIINDTTVVKNRFLNESEQAEDVSGSRSPMLGI